MKSGVTKIHGIGINDADYKLSENVLVSGKYKKTWRCPFYTVWASMIARGYSDKFKSKYPTYLTTKVCEDWLIFSNFRLWMEKQDWRDNHLDKDLIGDGEVYSPDTCCFIPNFVNTSLVLSNSIRGSLPVGVSVSTHKGRGILYQSMIKDRRGEVSQKNLGRYSTPHLAHRAWQIEKVRILKGVLTDYKQEACYNEEAGDSYQQIITRLQNDITCLKETKTLSNKGDTNEYLG